MHRVKRAIIMAAGFGSRLRPITLYTPKPLIYVNGQRMIDTIIKSLRDNSIDEIHIVVGYKKECFDDLLKEYTGIDFIENPYYDISNNISSLYVAREYLDDCIILDGDQMIYNPEVLSPYFEHSGYNSVWTEEYTKEWLQEVKEGRVVSCSRTGGKNGWQLYSVSRWSSADAKRLRSHVEIEFSQKKNYQIYWDDLAMFCYPEQYNLAVFPMNKGDIVEIDNIHELIEIDSNYKKYLKEK
ncbi:sugar phosphate nucleotidyltransferase [Mitsuokella multacida]|mgnify:CR=1 FL=1|uniref:Phosphocholine cytidylyltransferase family protein n=1 Tax=Mitsuokella multacida TaxID=52226 RepID=A0A414NYY8_9FIRM|nr:phosphocholine cytidylyltransferase family protein [Mitsuokella multacida]RHF52852.1 phosphocholine cytidylyltransferase family protein [Mitsuokella multacida]